MLGVYADCRYTESRGAFLGKDVLATKRSLKKLGNSCDNVPMVPLVPVPLIARTLSVVFVHTTPMFQNCNCLREKTD